MPFAGGKPVFHMITVVKQLLFVSVAAKFPFRSKRSSDYWQSRVKDRSNISLLIEAAVDC